MVDFTDQPMPAHNGTATLQAERDGSGIDVHQLAQHLLSCDGFPERQDKVLRVSSKKLFKKDKQLNLSRSTRYHLGLAGAKAIQRLMRRKGWHHEDYKMAECLTNEISPYHLHMNMLITTVREQASPEQQKHRMPKILNYHIIGCYAQSELSHGSNIASDQHVSHGPQTFVVQIWDAETHQPLPAIAVDDIGPKYGYASMDNGYMLFDHFRVPKSAMLSRYAKVSDKTGTFVRNGHPAVVYGSPTYIRVLPWLATTFGLYYTGEYMYMLYHKSRENIEKGDFGPLAELHSASSGLESLCTIFAADGIETCRRAMGGHGFGGGSGLVGLNADYLSKPTVEGDNSMITQQVAAYLIRKMADAIKDSSSTPKDPTDKLFQYYILNKDHRIPQNVSKDGVVDDRNIVEVFQ
ncbi:acyl-CoA oxidase [Alternaria panax]|uniref:Acyl-CoA oxidase n=1 Tax=Alternaria panax TaxID=48097 RepID=A0AAD4FF23_9PLEO|nr:acyl-CoA oxidase [Alternaria panax]